jgi:phosphoribosylformylglycinamidine cyclo-ligase
MKSHRPITYRDAGVDIEAGDELVERIKPHAKRTLRPEVMQGLGGFGALFELPLHRFRQPVLVSGTDGVGTKLKLAIELDRHDTVGIDLVAMCANDILVQGAEPLFFLDYFACAKLDVEKATRVIAGIAEGCTQAGAALVGGETAEMPGMYAAGDYDLAGFCVGAVEKDRMLDGSRVSVGDTVLGLASSGPHSNGYSLIRRIAADRGADLGAPFQDATLGETLLRPTHIYVRALLPLMQQGWINAAAHITGGGLTENLPRVLPAGTQAVLDTASWPRPPIFEWLKAQGGVDEAEMLRTFNCGIGMALIVDPPLADRVIEACADAGFAGYRIGVVKSADGEPRVSYDVS